VDPHLPQQPPPQAQYPQYGQHRQHPPQWTAYPPPPPYPPRQRQEERWGWEFRDARTGVPPFPEPPPALDVATPGWPARLAERLARARARHRASARLSVLLGGLAAGLAVPFGPLAALAPAAGTVWFGWRAWAQPAWLRRRADAEYRRWLATCVSRHTELQPGVARWVQHRRDYERWAARQVESAPRWFPVSPGTKERADVYGGSAEGWRHLLAAMAGSLLDAGARVSVVDLTQDDVTVLLRALAAHDGHPTSTCSLPEQSAEVNLLSGLSTEEVSAALAEAAHAAARDTSHEARTVDATVLQQVCEQLGAPLTFTRIHAALRVLMHQQGPGGDSPLRAEEFDRLDRLFGEAARRGSEDRVFRLAATLQRLAALDRPGGTGRGPGPRTAASTGSGVDGDAGTAGATGTSGRPAPATGLFPDGPALRVVQVTENATDLTGELLCQVVFQVTARQLQQLGADGERQRVLVVAGADAVPRAHVEQLDRTARRRGVRLVLMFRHLREDAVELLGGGEAAVFMRLGNAREAEQAATFIGREHRLVASQFTISHSDSSSLSVSDSTSRSTGTQESTTTGRQWSRSRSLDFGLLFAEPARTGSDSRGGQSSTTTGQSTSWTEGRTRSTQTGVSTSESVSYQRTYDYTVTPKFLQELSPTAFVLVDPRDPGSPRLGDCDPSIAGLPGVAGAPPAGAVPAVTGPPARQLPRATDAR
jgi:hypothetical protein